jgi:hypothetical protein
MIKFVVKDTDVAHQAVNWCMDRFSNKDWNVQPSNQGWRIYDFEFKNQQDAILFGLAWSEHV